MEEKIAKHFYVTGKVQGVWFRAETQKKAKDLQITGWVRNLPDGRVEVFAVGERSQLQKLETWLHQGPPRASVTDLTGEDRKIEEFNEFEIRD